MKQYVEVKDLRGNAFYINSAGRLTPDVNNAYGMTKRAAEHVLAQLAKQQDEPGSHIASFRTKPYRSR